MLNKHNMTHIMQIKMEMLSAIKMYIRKKKMLTHNVDKSLKALLEMPYISYNIKCTCKRCKKTHTHKHTHTLYRMIGVTDNVA